MGGGGGGGIQGCKHKRVTPVTRGWNVIPSDRGLTKRQPPDFACLQGFRFSQPTAKSFLKKVLKWTIGSISLAFKKTISEMTQNQDKREATRHKPTKMAAPSPTRRHVPKESTFGLFKSGVPLFRCESTTKVCRQNNERQLLVANPRTFFRRLSSQQGKVHLRTIKNGWQPTI